METLFLKEADRWLRQASNDIKAAEWNIEGGFFAQACFLSQQAAAKALRAFLFLEKEDSKETRSVVDLLQRAVTYEEKFSEFVGASGRLDLYYKTARFPDAIPGGIPAEVLTSKDAKEAAGLAGGVLKLAEETRKDYLPDAF